MLKFRQSSLTDKITKCFIVLIGFQNVSPWIRPRNSSRVRKSENFRVLHIVRRRNDISCKSDEAKVSRKRKVKVNNVLEVSRISANSYNCRLINFYD